MFDGEIEATSSRESERRAESREHSFAQHNADCALVQQRE
jgi:hypothetical protein